MRRPKVVSLRPTPELEADPPLAKTHPGAFGLRWEPRYRPDTRRWWAVGRNDVHMVAAVEIRPLPARINPQHLAFLTAQLLNDVGEDAANLLLAAHFEPNGDTDG